MAQGHTSLVIGNVLKPMTDVFPFAVILYIVLGDIVTQNRQYSLGRLLLYPNYMNKIAMITFFFVLLISMIFEKNNSCYLQTHPEQKRFQQYFRYKNNKSTVSWLAAWNFVTFFFTKILIGIKVSHIYKHQKTLSFFIHYMK